MFIYNHLCHLWGGYFAQENVIPNSGNVGIGTLNPTTKLDVHGRVKIDSSLYVNDSITIMGNTKMGGELLVEGMSKFSGPVKFNNINTLNNLNNSSFLFLNQGNSVRKIEFPDLAKAFSRSLYGSDCIVIGDDANNNTLYQAPIWRSTSVPNSQTGYLYTGVGCPAKVGIGTDTPTHALQVISGVRFNSTLQVGFTVGIGQEADDFARLTIKNNTNGRPSAIKINQVGNSNPYSKMLFMEYTEPTTEVLKVSNPETGHTPYLFEVSGKMTINNGSIDILRLESNGLLRAREIKVDAQTWPDYVFKLNYKLLPLSEVETFIQKEGHLPEFPSAQEVEENGMNVYETNKILVQKIEEITLYLIEQQKLIEAQNLRLNELETKNK